MKLQAEPMTLHAMKAKLGLHPAATCYIRVIATGHRDHLTSHEMGIAIDAAYGQSLDGPIVAYMGCVDGGSLGEAGLTLPMMDAARAAVADFRAHAGSMQAVEGVFDPFAPVGLFAPGVKAPVHGKPIVPRPAPVVVAPGYGYPSYDPGYDPNYGYDPYAAPPPAATAPPEAPPAPGSIAATVQAIMQLKLLESALSSPPQQAPAQAPYDPYAAPPAGSVLDLIPAVALLDAAAGPSAEAGKKYVELRAQWEAFHAQGVEKFPDLATDVLEWRQFCDEWDANSIPGNDVAGRLNAEIIRANRVRATLLEKQTGKPVFVQDLPGGQMRNLDDERGSAFLQHVAEPIDRWAKSSPFIDHLTNPTGPAIKLPGLPRLPGGIWGGLAIVGGALVVVKIAVEAVVRRVA